MRIIAVAAAVAGLALAQAAPRQPPLALVQTIELPRVKGRIDHLAFDLLRRRVLVAALGNDTLEVVDASSGRRLRTLAGFAEPQGIAMARDAARVAVANGRTGAVDILDARTFTRLAEVRLGSDADNVRYDSITRQWWVGYGTGSVAAIDPVAARVLGEVHVPGHPESFQLEHASGRLFVNVPSAQQVMVIDRNALRVEASWPITAAAANFAMALDEAGHRLFIACRNPSRLVVLDTRSGRTIGTADIVGDADDLFFDARRGRLYVSGGEGFLDIIGTAPAERFARVARLRTAPGARTSLFVPETDTLYVAVPRRGTRPAELRMYRAG